jgi:hypothetical protein
MVCAGFLGIVSGLTILDDILAGKRTELSCVPGVANFEADTCYRPAAVMPPSTVRTAPVMNEACSEARKKTAFATSTGSPIRRSG